MNDIKSFFTKEVLLNTYKVTLCGSFWDPIYAQDFLEIVKYFCHNNVRVVVSTNGYNNKKKFWNELWRLKNFYIIFWIDGITQKTHSSYRINTKLINVLKNAKEFIDTWWEAHWQFLVFWSNEYQIPRAKKLSKQLWFKEFILRKSREYNESLTIPKWDYFLTQKKENKTWKCEYKERNMWYISSAWYVLPCCYLSDTEFNKSYLKSDLMNIKKSSFEKIIESSVWISKIWKIISSNWENVCYKKCWYKI